MSAPQWLPDPSGRHELRQWDGTRWTEVVMDGGVPSRDKHGPPSGVAGAPVKPARTSTLGTAVGWGFGLAAGWALFSLVGIVLLIGGCAALLSSSSSDSASSSATPTAEAVATPADLRAVGTLASGDVKANYKRFKVVSTTCGKATVDRLGPDTWTYRCVVRMKDKAGGAHAFSKDVQCFEAPPYANMDNCTNSTGKYPKSLYKPKQP